MDEHRVTGTARNMGGRIEQEFGHVTGDAKSQAQGIVDQAQGTAEKFYGHAKDATSGAAKHCFRQGEAQSVPAKFQREQKIFAGRAQKRSSNVSSYQR